jgi:hypothetical protein
MGGGRTCTNLKALGWKRWGGSVAKFGNWMRGFDGCEVNVAAVANDAEFLAGIEFFRKRNSQAPIRGRLFSRSKKSFQASSERHRKMHFSVSLMD